jgi:antitoxin (DNA-binding transcriptional repressor) of toxin-antitoxin stability system
MTTIAIEKAQRELPELIQRALKGEEIFVASDGGKTSVRLVPTGFDEAIAIQRGTAPGQGSSKSQTSFSSPSPMKNADMRAIKLRDESSARHACALMVAAGRPAVVQQRVGFACSTGQRYYCE